MRPVLSRAQMRAFDARHIAAGVPGIVLMENAGRGAAHLIGLKARPRPKSEAPRTGTAVAGSCIRCADERALSALQVVIVAGVGNNAGDGFVVARHLASRGADVRVYAALGRAFKGDALLALSAMEAVGILLQDLPDETLWPAVFSEADVLVDAILGTGAARPLEPSLLKLARALNEADSPVIALDIPTGLCADTGVILGACVEAEHTVTFGHLKRGLLTTFGQQYAGTITVSHIGVPAELPESEVPSAWLLEEGDVRALLAPRSAVLHKGRAGRVGLLCGSPGTVGAARLCAHGALRAGAGLVTIVSDPATTRLLESEVQEVMTRAWSEESASADDLSEFDALVIGPGLGRSEAVEAQITRALKVGAPSVLDADALRFVADLPLTTWQELRLANAHLVLTPHPGEAAALLQMTVAEVERDRFLAAEKLVERFDAVVVLKGSRTIIAGPGQVPVVCAFGTPALATGGTGDVLAGILGAGLAYLHAGSALGERGVFDCALLAVSLHALCAEAWSSAHGDRGLLAHEIADELPRVIARLTT